MTQCGLPYFPLFNVEITDHVYNVISNYSSMLNFQPIWSWLYEIRSRNSSYTKVLIYLRYGFVTANLSVLTAIMDSKSMDVERNALTRWKNTLQIISSSLVNSYWWILLLTPGVKLIFFIIYLTRTWNDVHRLCIPYPEGASTDSYNQNAMFPKNVKIFCGLFASLSSRNIIREWLISIIL